MMKDEEFFREVDANCYDPEAILKDMNLFGVNVQVRFLFFIFHA